MNIVETGEDRSAESTHEVSASAVRPRRSRRRRLTQDEERAIGKLYADSNTPTAAIRARFGLSESTLYRVVQRQGVALRGHTGFPTRSKGPGTTAAALRRSSSPGAAAPANSKSAAAPGKTALPSGARTGKQPSRGSARRAIAKLPTTPPAGPALSRNGGRAQQQFRLEFLAESVFEATDVRDALRQAQSLGAVDITAVTLQN